MDLFEYITVAFAFILSLGVARLVTAAPVLLSRERRFDLHVGIVVGVLAFTPMLFWVVWSFRDADWTLPTFYLLLATPVSYLVTTIFLAPENINEVTDWRAYYFANRQAIYGGLVAILIALNASRFLLLDDSVIGWRSVLPMVIVATFIAMAVSGCERLHRAGQLLTLVAMVVVSALNLGTRAAG